MEKTFGELTNDEKKALMCAWVDGETIEWRYFNDPHSWWITSDPSWSRNLVFRIKPKPPVVKTFEAFGFVYSNVPDTIYWLHQDQSGDAAYKVVVTFIDGVVQPNALVEKL